MATFSGTPEEFVKYLGPLIRNKIQAKTRSHKASLNHICQACKKPKELHAAHARGSDRVKIIKRILRKYPASVKGIVKCSDLSQVIDVIMKTHDPITKAFKFLCEGCHRKYDAGTLDL
jgi:hypothetical protein